MWHKRRALGISGLYTTLLALQSLLGSCFCFPIKLPPPTGSCPLQIWLRCHWYPHPTIQPSTKDSLGKLPQNRGQSPLQWVGPLVYPSSHYWRHLDISSKVSKKWNGRVNYWSHPAMRRQTCYKKKSDGRWTGSKHNNGRYNLEENGEHRLLSA